MNVKKNIKQYYSNKVVTILFTRGAPQIDFQTALDALNKTLNHINDSYN